MKEFLLARKRYLYCLLMLCLTLWGQAHAQQRSVTGTVTDGPSKDPLPGVSVLVQGSSVGTITDANGSYTISVSSDDAVLVFTFVGYAKSEIRVGSQSTIDVPLTADITSLQEIVVVGYGEQKKSVVTGSITSVKASDLENMPITRVEQALQGRTSGLTIAASSGQPGSSSTVRIRGTTSLNFSDPLYVVDGVPIDVGGIDYLNQNDIESIEVLKDAASAAIYGTRAANGVILITTKKGKAGSLQVNYSGYYGTQAPARKIQLLNATQYATLRNEASVADGKGIVFENPSSLGKGTDWQKLIFNNNAKIQNHDLSISGGSEKSTYYASFGYLNQEGIVATDISKYERLNVRFNSSHKVTKWFRFGNNIGYSHINNKGIGNTNNEFGGILSSAVNLDPITPAVVTDPAVAADVPYSNHQYAVRDANGNPYGISSIVMQEMSNPLAYIKTHLGNHGFSDNIVGNAYVEVEPLKGLIVKSNIGAKLAYWGSESFTPLAYFNSVSQNSTNSFY
ncbi:MAG TPA: SusC/RagA family TonB-linked outer membrane protein, partial [Cyclobacteriaceae bacterium]|nr:SusC/RagA family TonB-linked outer membrane protein [Cyclobacteriaceae bacterium]